MEKFHYYVVFSFLNPANELRITCRYIRLDHAVETEEDVKALSEEGVFGSFKAITVISWRRLQ